jgi:DNA-binding response OmpR family regulator
MTLNFNLSDQDALSLMREVHADPATSGLPVIVLCADWDEGKLQAGRGSLGVVDWLSKPIDERRLLADLESVRRAGARPRILHVEDDADVRNVVATIARGIADFAAAGSVAQARATLEREKFDLVLLDLGLPDGSGWELLPLINGLVPPVRVVIFSARDAAHGNETLPYAFLVKSQTSEECLIDVIREAVRTTA